jgi:hypothetical protein
MRTHFAVPVIVFAVSLATSALADIPPPPPPELRQELPSFGPDEAPAFRPLPIAIAGLSLGIAITLIGFGISRRRGHSGVLVAVAIIAIVVLAATSIGVLIVHRAWKDYDARLAHYEEVKAEMEAISAKHAALAAKYKSDLANWHPRGPVPRPRNLRNDRDISLAAAVFGASTQGAFLHSLPWAVFAMNVEKNR